MEFIMAVALLCQTQPGSYSTYEDAQKDQLKCQKYYVNCAGAFTSIKDCIKNRKIK